MVVHTPLRAGIDLCFFLQLFSVTQNLLCVYKDGVGFRVLLANGPNVVGAEAGNGTIGLQFFVFLQHEDEELRTQLKEIVFVVIDLLEFLVDEVFQALFFDVLHSEDSR
jgi:hypothetical protein